MPRQQSSGAALLFGFVLFAGLYLTSDTTLNQPAPAFSLPETYGGRVDLSTYRGQPVLLIFWMTSCGICRQELPLVSRMAPEFRRRGISLMTVHLGQSGEVRDYLRSNRIAVTSLVDAEGSVGRAYRVSGVPKLVLIGSDGKIRRTSAGMTDEDTLREWIDAAGTP